MGLPAQRGKRRIQQRQEVRASRRILGEAGRALGAFAKHNEVMVTTEKIREVPQSCTTFADVGSGDFDQFHLVPEVLRPATPAMQRLVAAFARSVREAQAWLGALQLLPSLPLVFASIANLAPTTKLMMVPSLSQHFLIQRLLRAEPLEPLQVGLSVGVALMLGAVLTVLAGRIYRRESLLA